MSTVPVPFPAMPPAAIVFDCDGLLLDTEGSWSVGQTGLFARHGREFGPEHKQALVGRSMLEAGPIYERFLDRPGHGTDLTDELVALEDTATGLAAARAAGMRTIGVPSVSTAHLEADLVAGSLVDPAVLAALGLGEDGR